MVVIVVISFILFVGYPKVRSKCLRINPSYYSQSIIINGLKLYYETLGNKNNPRLVFIHGWPMSFLGYEPVSFKPVLKKLSEYFYIVAVTPTGILQSEPPNEEWNLTKNADLLNIFLNQLGWGKSIIMGQSYGGGIASTYASIYPESTRVLIMVDSAISDRVRADTKLNKLKSAAFPLYKALLSSRLVPFSIKQCLAYQVHSMSEEYTGPEYIRRYTYMINNGILPTVDYKTLVVPTFLVWGKQDEITPLATAEELNRQIPNSKLILLEGKHRILYENPKEVVESIVTALQESELYNE